MKTKSKRQVFNQIKKKICNLDSYTDGEEILIVKEVLNLSNIDLLKKEVYTDKELRKINRVVTRRLKDMPLNKILKKQNFYGYDFFINSRVLAPRKETELLVEMALKDCKKNCSILDLCCGSGCIGLSIAKNLKEYKKIVLSDISFRALSVARKNKRKLNINGFVYLKRSDLFQGLKKFGKFDIIVCNPPYISSSDCENLSKSVKNYDPIISLDGGKQGLDFYEKIATNLDEYLQINGRLFLEIGYNQKQSVQKIFEEKGYKTKCFKDYSNCDRIVIVERG